MKVFKIFSVTTFLSVIIFSCKNDQNDYGQMKGVNHFSRNDVFSTEQISFENSVGLSLDTLKRSARIAIDANTFVNEDGSAYSGKVVLIIQENFVRGFFALNSIPTVSDSNPLYTEGAIYSRAVDLVGNDLKIASGKHLNISIPGTAVASTYTMYYGVDDVKDPSPANTSLFNWKEASNDTVQSFQDTNTSVYYYMLTIAQLGWACCSKSVVNSNPVGIRVRVKGIYPIFQSNTAVYIVPKLSQSAFRLWDYDSQGNLFSTDHPYLNKGDQVYVIAIAYCRHFKIYYARDLITVGDNTAVEVDAVLMSNAGAIVGNLSTL